MGFSKSDLEKFDALKCRGNELYDLAVPGMQPMYDEIVRNRPAHAILRDTTSFKEIKDSINDAARKHPGDGIVILSGAYRHIIGSLADLQKTFNIKYVPIDGMQISTDTYDATAKVRNKNGSDKVTKDDLEVQIKRDIGVAKYLGQDTMEALREAIESKPYDPGKKTIVVVAAHQTGLHHLDNYTESQNEALAAIEQIIPALSERPGFVSYIGEDMHLENMHRTITEPEISTYPRNAFLQKLHQTGIPVEIGAFGHLEKTRERDYEMRSIGLEDPSASSFVEHYSGLEGSHMSSFMERLKLKSGGSQNFRGGERTDPKPRDGGWSDNL